MLFALAAAVLQLAAVPQLEKLQAVRCLFVLSLAAEQAQSRGVELLQVGGAERFFARFAPQELTEAESVAALLVVLLVVLLAVSLTETQHRPIVARMLRQHPEYSVQFVLAG